ncbi:MAG TPA: hypothetical protein VJT77_00570, partial [Burkholderiales bacterium]|nr:hypothetical protein [Burkholderiales bacterium]
CSPGHVMALPAEITPEHLVPLPFAVRMVYLLAHGFEPPAEHFLDRLNGLAYSLAAASTMYVLEGPELPPRPLRPDELAGGHFRNGAQEFRFLDDRPSIAHIGVTRDGIEKAIANLRA